jgi:hypothetical protein
VLTSDDVPSGGKAIFAFCELFALAFAFEGASAYLNEKPWPTVTRAAVLATLFFFAGLKLPALITQIGTDSALFRFKQFAQTQRFWLGALSGIALGFTLAGFIGGPLHRWFPEPAGPTSGKIYNVIKGWGPILGMPRDIVEIVVDGHELIKQSGINPKSFRLAAVCYHNRGTIDTRDISDLQKSSLHDLRDEDVQMTIQLNTKFMDEYLKQGWTNTNYVAIVVPNGVTMDQFSTMRQAFSLGVLSVSGVVGPP